MRQPSTSLKPAAAFVLVAATASLMSACVTINVYFPAAEAQKAADKIIDDVWGTGATPQPTPGDTSRLESKPLWLVAADFVMPVAAAAEPKLDVSSAEVKRLSGAMEARFPQLEPLLNSGTLGLTNDGYIGVRDAGSVPLAERNAVRSLVANENADRASLYREIAVANGQPQWEAQIRSAFAARWIARAKTGWYYQDAGGAWLQK